MQRVASLLACVFIVSSVISSANCMYQKKPVEEVEATIDPCVAQKCPSNELCVVDETNKAHCVDKSRVVSLETHQLRKREVASPRVYYPGVCGINECRYGDCEIYNNTYFRCHCTKGVTGTNCDRLDTSGNPCAANPCYGDSRCINLNTGKSEFVCICPAGRGGPLCDGHTNQCQCEHKGVCVQLSIGVYTCNCIQPYGGHLCQFFLGATQFCQNSPCQNGGTCTWQSTCKCATGFTGTFCETAISPQSAQTTTASATTNVAGTTTTAGTTVPTTTPTFCTSTICQNGGKCLQLSSNIAICICQAGFSGPFCNIASTTSTASTTTGTTTVTTTTGSTTTAAPSTACDADIVNPCQNGGTCTVVNNNIVCQCPATFSGPFCKATPFCKSNPCKNGGQCVQLDSIKGACICASNDFQGIFCEVSLKCNPNPCQNNQQCLNINETPKCFCSSKYTGQFCETPV